MTNISLAIYAFITSTMNRMRDERGQDIVEYVVLAGFIGIALAVVMIATPLSAYMSNFVVSMGNCIQFQTADCP
jgi:Flp pilus assembly pilin Flp